MEQRYKTGEKAYLTIPIEVKKVDKELGTLEAIFSTQDVDRHGDTVLQDGWDLTNFKKNPVILNSHNYGDATEVIGKASNVKVENKKLQGTITFAIKENPKAKVIFDLYAGGFLSAFSVGFIPVKFKQNKDGSFDWFIIEESELLEVSAVSVPANARALAKEKGIEVDLIENKEIESEKTIDDTDEEDEPEDVEPSVEEDTDKDGDEDTVEDEPVIPDDIVTDAVKAEPVKKVSYNAKVINAIHNIESKEKRKLRQVAEILNSLLSDDGVIKDKKVKEQVRSRKVNQAIRGLMQLK